MTRRSETRLPIPHEQVEAFCRKWNITRMELFGSALRDDFDSQRSDLDLLITFAPGKTPGFDFFSLPDELEEIFHRRIDLSTRPSVEQSRNRIRKASILASAETVYEEG